MLKNEESFYVSDAEGDMMLVRIYEAYDSLVVEVGEFSMSIDSDGAYEIVDALTMVLESMERR
jgi:hypothetical protein